MLKLQIYWVKHLLATATTYKPASAYFLLLLYTPLPVDRPRCLQELAEQGFRTSLLPPASASAHLGAWDGDEGHEFIHVAHGQPV